MFWWGGGFPSNKFKVFLGGKEGKESLELCRGIKQRQCFKLLLLHMRKSNFLKRTKIHLPLQLIAIFHSKSALGTVGLNRVKLRCFPNAPSLLSECSLWCLFSSRSLICISVEVPSAQEWVLRTKSPKVSITNLSASLPGQPSGLPIPWMPGTHCLEDCSVFA